MTMEKLIFEFSIAILAKKGYVVRKRCVSLRDMKKFKWLLNDGDEIVCVLWKMCHRKKGKYFNFNKSRQKMKFHTKQWSDKIALKMSFFEQKSPIPNTQTIQMFSHRTNFSRRGRREVLENPSMKNPSITNSLLWIPFKSPKGKNQEAVGDQKSWPVSHLPHIPTNFILLQQRMKFSGFQDDLCCALRTPTSIRIVYSSEMWWCWCTLTKGKPPNFLGERINRV